MTIAGAVSLELFLPAGQFAKPARGPRLLDRDRRPRLGCFGKDAATAVIKSIYQNLTRDIAPHAD
jgi:hypothetical protein